MTESGHVGGSEPDVQCGVLIHRKQGSVSRRPDRRLWHDEI